MIMPREIHAPVLDRLSPDPVSLGVPVLNGAVQIGYLSSDERGTAAMDRLHVAPGADEILIRSESGAPLQVELVDYDPKAGGPKYTKVFVAPLAEGLALRRGTRPLRWTVDGTSTWVQDYEGLQEFAVMVGLFAARKQKSL